MEALIKELEEVKNDAFNTAQRANGYELSYQNGRLNAMVKALEIVKKHLSDDSFKTWLEEQLEKCSNDNLMREHWAYGHAYRKYVETHLGKS